MICSPRWLFARLCQRLVIAGQRIIRSDLYLNGAKRIGGVLKETKLPFILMDRSVVPVRKIYGEVFLHNISIQVACRVYDYETAGYFVLRVGVDGEKKDVKKDGCWRRCCH